MKNEPATILHQAGDPAGIRGRSPGSEKGFPLVYTGGTHPEDLKRARFIQIDETPYRYRKRQGYVWVIRTDTVCMVLALTGRGNDDILPFVGDLLDKPVTVDGYSVYLSLFGTLQRCWAHILRDAEDVCIVMVIKNAIKSRTHMRALLAAPPLIVVRPSHRSMPHTPQPCRPGQTDRGGEWPRAGSGGRCGDPERAAGIPAVGPPMGIAATQTA